MGQTIRQPADPVRAADAKRSEQFAIAEQIDRSPVAAPTTAPRRMTPPLTLLPPAAGPFAHRPVQHETDPVAAAVVQPLQRRSWIRALTPIEPVSHRQQVADRERRLAIVHVGSRQVARKPPHDTVIDAKTPSLNGEAGDERGHALADGLKGVHVSRRAPAEYSSTTSFA